MVCFTPNKRKKRKKNKGINIEYLLMVEMKPLVKSRIFFFWFLCAQKLSFVDHGREIYALAWAGRQVGGRSLSIPPKVGKKR